MTGTLIGGGGGGGGAVLDREPRGASLAEKVTNFYACSSDLHTLPYVKVIVCRTHSSGYGQGGGGR